MIHLLFNYPIINLLTLCNALGEADARRAYFLREIISTGKETGNSLSPNYSALHTLIGTSDKIFKSAFSERNKFAISSAVTPGMLFLLLCGSFETLAG